MFSYIEYVHIHKKIKENFFFINKLACVDMYDILRANIVEIFGFPLGSSV